MDRDHLTDEEIAGLIDGNIGESDREELFRHVSRCPGCFDLLRDSGIYAGVLDEGSPEFRSRSDLVEAGLAVAMSPARNVSSSGRVKYLAAAAAVILVVATFLMLPREESLNGGLSAEMLGPVVEAVESATGMGMLVLPGGEDGVGGSPGIYRSGYVPIDDSLDSSLKYLRNFYIEEQSAVDAVCWLISGYVATGHIDIARDLLADSRKKRISDTRLDNLEAIIAVLDGKPERADSILNNILAEDPGNGIARLNYSVLLSDFGRRSDALSLLDEIIERHPDTWMAKRAVDLRETISSR